ncbi:hypothetical protein MSG28_015827 [Choristoneura fumiferana]|uniref:Uncharacterized protein n=1 Tax=Choristoneura fumiferana TaxID=7141 RepID=A0ACC0KBJ8_CHOFU|nr:hypothetical protein MSG28_015827 [Choristoneura fumiferana]
MQVHPINKEKPSDPLSNRRCTAAGAGSVKWATGRVNVGDQALHGNDATGKTKLTLSNIMKIGNWNVRGLLQPGKLEILERELMRCDISICGLSETHWRGNGHFRTENHTIYFSGHKNESRNGVAITIPNELSNCVMGYEPVSDRIISIKIKAKPVNFNIMQVYAPTSEADDSVIEMFYTTLEAALHKVSNREILVISGDFNAKIGSSSVDSELREVIGPYGLGNRNERGERLIQFAADNGLAIANSLFKHHPRRLYTWTSPGGAYRNQIDYVLVKTRWKTSIRNAHTLPGADCGSDHQLVVCTLKLKLKAARKIEKTRRITVTNPPLFMEAMKARWTEWSARRSDDDTAEQLWSEAKTMILDAAKSTQPRRFDGSTKRQHWMSDDTLVLIEERRRLKASGASVQNQNEYTNRIQAACRRDKNNFLRTICAEVEAHAGKNETKDLHQKIRYITKKFKTQSWAIEDAKGNVITELENILEVWQKYCQSLFLDSDSHVFSSTVPCDSDMEPDILKEEVRSAIKHLKSGKAVGSDEIPIETIRCCGDYGVDIFHRICNLIWRTGVWPTEWTHSLFIPLHKKGSTTKCSNYRLIALITHASKVLLHILHQRLNSFISKEIAPEQAGFVKGRGTREQILIVRQIIEKAKEFNRPVYICFVDFQKAFDSVRWPRMWKTLLDMGVPQHLVHVLRTLYENNTASVRMDNVSSQRFCPTAGVRQGCILSPLLFNAYTEHIMRIALENWTDGIPIGGKNISNLRYADDTTLLATSEDKIGELLTRIETVSLEFGLKLNRTKTKIMIVDRGRNNAPEVTEIANCQVVQSYVYLGSLVSNKGGSEDEIKRRMVITRCAMDRLSKVWRDRNITKTTKIRLVRALVFPIFLYGAETWTVKERERQRIDALEMWCWRRLLRVSWTQHRTNVSILKELGIGERLSTAVHSRILQFFGHVTRRGGDSVERLVVQGRVNGSRSRGRSPLRWTDQIKSLTDKSLNECARQASARDKWRTVVKRYRASRVTTTALPRVSD